MALPLRFDELVRTGQSGSYSELALLGQVTRARAEEIVRELANAGDIQRDQAQEWVDNLIERRRKTSEQILDLARGLLLDGMAPSLAATAV